MKPSAIESHQLRRAEYWISKYYSYQTIFKVDVHFAFSRLLLQQLQCYRADEILLFADSAEQKNICQNTGNHLGLLLWRSKLQEKSQEPLSALLTHTNT